MKGLFWEWLASVLVGLGVVLIAGSQPGVVTGVETLWAFLVGMALLTIGVRVAIECGKAGR